MPAGTPEVVSFAVVGEWLHEDQSARQTGAMPSSIDALTERAIGLIATLTRRSVYLANVLITIVAIVGLFTASLCVLVMSGVGLVITLGFIIILTAVGLGAAVLARLRFRQMAKDLPALATEIRSLIVEDPRAREAIDAYVVEDGSGNDVIVADLQPVELATSRSRRSSVFAAGRRLVTLRGQVGDRVGQFATITQSVATAKAFPFLAFVSFAAVLALASFAVWLLLVGLLSLILPG